MSDDEIKDPLLHLSDYDNQDNFGDGTEASQIEIDGEQVTKDPSKIIRTN